LVEKVAVLFARATEMVLGCRRDETVGAMEGASQLKAESWRGRGRPKWL